MWRVLETLDSQRVDCLLVKTLTDPLTLCTLPAC